MPFTNTTFRKLTGCFLFFQFSFTVYTFQSGIYFFPHFSTAVIATHFNSRIKLQLSRDLERLSRCFKSLRVTLKKTAIYRRVLTLHIYMAVMPALANDKREWPEENLRDSDLSYTPGRFRDTILCPCYTIMLKSVHRLTDI